MSKLQFIETISVDAFKRVVNCTKVQVMENPKKLGSYFLIIDSDSSFRGAIAVGKYSLKEIGDDPMISKVEGDNGEQFWMMHKRHTGNANVVLEF